ncbi:ShlB/FhaC/HecB family hemolysin secretion/activation protein [Hydrocarboniclastica marina]|uniref:ShlB/FhaC/HecB family hemolysin secretion/activation protein n=1 Tax=Hydrocarboniclastica marina TaxID=2259620 RepID=A0A4P7XFU7_9ALTE|nr:ShlB/FhaC/HecB family hemolysin secretion/activation protein [Hydrocarboniclastica marina]MAL97067.1 hypothetical protein [Alteromonadaceae bacterium]QCF25483.1 ShlB/FhaC/HecB family hemolysin secretion/activation protein [Hydrocarboniclastica marina]|tara:strand:+ start:795 stop:2513 length:1719 start_codon:yes stop_codon:yes gene_type:complete
MPQPYIPACSSRTDHNKNRSRGFGTANAFVGFFRLFTLSLALTLGAGAANAVEVRFEFGPRAAPVANGEPGLDAIENGRVTVRSVSLKGRPVEFPDLGISRARLEQILVRHIRKNEGHMSVSDMHRMADELTLFYREQGLSFAEVYVTPQEIIQGHLVMDVVIGLLSELRLVGNAHYGTDQILDAFNGLLLAPVFAPDIEAALERLNRLPGLEVFGVFSMGTHPGETRLNLKVREDNPRETLLRLDNHGIKNTGKYRAILQHKEHNLFRTGGSFTATAMTTEEGGNLFGGLSYRQPVGLAHTFAASVSHNQFAINGEFEALGLQGTLQDATMGWEYLPEHSPAYNATLGLNVSGRKADIISDEFRELLESDYQYVAITPFIRLEQSKARWRLRHVLNISPSFGSILDSTNTELEDQYLILKTNYTLRHQWLKDAPEYQISFAFDAQYSADPLPASERQSLTGPSQVRGFDAGLYSADSHYRVSLMQTLYRYDWGSAWQLVPYTYTDYAYGQKELETTDEASFLSAGLGLEFAYGKRIQAGLNWGYAIDSSIKPETGADEAESALYGYLSTRF